MKQQLDARGLICPLPVIKTQDYVKHMSAGEEVTVVCTDPGALHDIPTWCRINGHEVVTIEERETEILITIKAND